MGTLITEKILYVEAKCNDLIVSLDGLFLGETQKKLKFNYSSLLGKVIIEFEDYEASKEKIKALLSFLTELKKVDDLDQKGKEKFELSLWLVFELMEEIEDFVKKNQTLILKMIEAGLESADHWIFYGSLNVLQTFIEFHDEKFKLTSKFQQKTLERIFQLIVRTDLAPLN